MAAAAPANGASSGPVTVAALYRFTPFDDHAGLREPLLAACESAGVRGTILLAGEGINGTIAGPREGVDAVLAHIRTLPGCAALDVKFSEAPAMPFHRMKVRLKREIVTMGEEGVDPLQSVGRYVDPHDWNDLIADPDTVVIDTRNAYETRIGKFAGALDPGTESFRDFPAWFRQNREALLAGNKRVAMYCTGGIRCEKSTSFLRSEGVEEVFHLKGGILRYLENVPREESLWEGECFVFDQRVSVAHDLEPGTHSQCHACREPLSPQEVASPDYVEGVRCPYCAQERDDAQRLRYAERQRQEELARKRGEAHLGQAVKPR